MRKLLLLSLFLATACTQAPIGSGQSADIHCTDSKDACDAKALAACPKGYAIVKEAPPVGTGIYYTDHESPTTAREGMVYSMTVQCK